MIKIPEERIETYMWYVLSYKVWRIDTVNGYIRRDRSTQSLLSTRLRSYSFNQSIDFDHSK